MTRIRVCSECGGWSGCHFAGCPEDVAPDEEGDETDEQETPDEFPTMKL